MTAAPMSLPTHARNAAPTTASGTEMTHLRRLRWAVRAVLTLGVAASIAANVLHARPNLISQLIAAWPPLALLLTVELISRVPAHRRSLAVLRLLATTAIAGIAAWVSYWHMKGVAARYGETAAAASYLLPVSVDGLVVVASISLVEIASRVRTVQSDLSTSNVASTATAKPELAPSKRAAAASVESVASQVVEGQSPSEAAPDPITRVDSGHGADQLSGNLARHPLLASGLGTVLPLPSPAGTTPGSGPLESDVRSPAPAQLPEETLDAEGREAPGSEQEAAAPLGDETDEVPSNTAAAVAYWYRRDPALHPAEIGARIGRSERTVRRYWPPRPNGHDATGSNRAEPPALTGLGRSHP